MSVFDPKPAGKYSRYDISPLLAVTPMAPQAPPAPAAPPPQPAFAGPSPAPAEPAFAQVDQRTRDRDATTKLIDRQMQGIKKNDKEGKPFFKLWQDSDDEDKEEVANQVERGFKGKGVSMQEQAEKVAAASPEAAELAAQYGRPDDKTAFGGGGKEQKKKWDRKAWGGFLMEAGLRILASQRQDAGGAIGEGVLGTMDAQRKRALENEDRSIAQQELERDRTRDAAADRRAENADVRAGNADERADSAEGRADREMDLAENQEGRYATESAARIKQINAQISAGNIDIIMDKDGKHHVIKKNKTGTVRDENGKPIVSETTADLSASQIATFERQVLRDRAAVYKQVREESSGYVSNDPEIQAIQDATDPKERKRLMDELVNKRMQDIYGTDVTSGADTGNVVDFNDMK